MLQDPARWGLFPERCRNGCGCSGRSRLPGRNDLLVETFPRGDRWFLVAYCFEGRNAHQTLGMLLTRRMERAGCAAGLRRHRLRAGDLVGQAGRATSQSCSTRTCWATTWKPGWPKARC
jgi:hypothetical protein